jgi:MoaA/NifB/PqqE/SkfB family radical SAM enzyme
VRRQADLLYLEPITACNLHCRMCYTNVINGPNRRVLSADLVLDFVRRYMALAPPSVELYWCGTGEVFLHPDFPAMVGAVYAEFGERVTSQTVQTNGTMTERLRELPSMHLIDFFISVDGVEELHDWHRGAGTFAKTMQFCRTAHELGCRSIKVRTLLTRENIRRLDELYDQLRYYAGDEVMLGLILPYTDAILEKVRGRSLTINQKVIEDAQAIEKPEAEEILARLYGNRYEIEECEAVDNYISLTPFGVMTCCNGIINIGQADDAMDELFKRLEASESDCRSCEMFPCQ